MKNLLLFITVLIFSFSHSLYSQNLTKSGAGYLDYSTFYNRTEYQTNNPNIEGTPYLSETFTMGTISPLDERYPIRYNAVSDVFEVKQLDDNIIILNKSNLDYLIKINNTYYKSFKFKESKDGFGYFNIVTKNENVNLLKRTTIKFFKEKKAVNSYSTGKKAYFDEAKTALFIYFKKDESIKELPTRTKSFTALFPGKEDAIKKYIKSEKLNLKKESDVIKVINYANTI